MRTQPTTRNGGRKRRAPRGTGRLYKRTADGREHPADWQGAGAYWLAYRIPDPNGGTGLRQRIPLRDPDGNPITDRAQAEAERKRIVAPYRTGSTVETLRTLHTRLTGATADHAAAVEEANPPLRILDAWHAYVASPDRPDSGEATLPRYRAHWERFATWLGAKHPGGSALRDITPEVGAEYAADLSDAGYGPNTFNKHVGFLRLLFRVLGDAGRVAVNPFAKVKRRTLRTNSRRELTLPELTQILAAADGELAMLLHVGACTGLRLGDCATLTWGEVDLARGIVRRVPNKTAKKRKPVLLGIPPALRDRLEAIPGAARTGFVLPNMAATYRRDAASITKRVKALILDCGIDVHAPGTGERIKRKPDGTPERHRETGKVLVEDTGTPAVVEVGFHSLRHTWVSMHAARGTPQAIVQASVGHASPSVTQHYTHVDEATARDVALALPAFAGKAAPRHEEPLPAWAREIIAGMTGENLEAARAELLARGGAA